MALKPPSHLRLPTRVSRREFVSRSALGSAALASCCRRGAQPGARRAGPVSPADARLRMAFIGIGNRGNDMVKTFAATGLANIVAFCDVDLDGAAHGRVAQAVPGGAGLPGLPRDVRQDGRRRSTPSSSRRRTTRTSRWRCSPCATGKHVYVEKPLAHTFQRGRPADGGGDEVPGRRADGQPGPLGQQLLPVQGLDRGRHHQERHEDRRLHEHVAALARVDASSGFPAGEPVRPGSTGTRGTRRARSIPFSTQLHPRELARAGSTTATARSATGARTSSTRPTSSCELGLPHTIEAVRLEGREPRSSSRRRRRSASTSRRGPACRRSRCSGTTAWTTCRRCLRSWAPARR